MATNQFLPFGTGTEDPEQIMPQANYTADIRRQAGNPQGIASRSLNNKALRQSSTMAAAVAQAISDLTGDDMMDDGNVAAKVASIKEAIPSLPESMTDAGALEATDTFALRRAGAWVKTTMSRIGEFVTGIYTVTLHAGIGGVAQTLLAILRGQPANVKNFGVLMDGSDDTAAYQVALNAMETLYIPAGTLIHSNVSVPAGRTIIGAGRNATILRLKDGANANGHAISSANDIEFQNLTLDGNSANNLTAGNGALISGTSARVYFRNVRATNWRLAGIAATSGTSFVELHSCRIDSNIFDGFQCTTSSCPSVFFSTVTDNGRYGAVFGSGCTNVRDIGSLYKNNAQGGSIMVGGSDAIRLGNLADTNGTGHGLQYNAVARGLYVGNISKGNGISGLDFTLGSNYGAAIANISFNNAVRGIEIDSGSYYNSTIGNNVYRNGEVGISVYRSPATTLIGNNALENGVSASPKYGIRLWDDLNTLPSSNCRLIGNNASDDRGGSSTQTYGLSIEAASTTGTVLNENKVSPNVTGGVSSVAGAIFKARDNAGFVTQNTGAGFFAAADTAVVITHGLSVTPAARDINITLTNAPNTPVQDIWIDTITSTQFTVHVRTAPGGSGMGFGWSVNAYV